MRVYVIHHAPNDDLGPGHEVYARRRGGVIININHDWDMDRICRRVLQRSPRGVGVLYLCCHGNVGDVELGKGLTAANAWKFQLLRGHWVGQFPRIEVHACLVASATPTVCQPAANVPPAQRSTRVCATRGTNAHTGVDTCCSGGTPSRNAPGNAIMQALADAAQIGVIAGVDVQRTDADFRFEGEIRRYRPRPTPLR